MDRVNMSMSEGQLSLETKLAKQGWNGLDMCRAEVADISVTGCWKWSLIKEEDLKEDWWILDSHNKKFGNLKYEC